MNKKRHKEEFAEGLDLLLPNYKEDKITRQFYRDLTQLTKNKNSNNKIKKLNFFELILFLIKWQR